MFPTLIEFAGIRLATYGVLVALGYLAGILWLHARRERMGLGEDEFWNLIYAVFLGAIIGGKLLYWLVFWKELFSGELHPIRDFRYGFVFFGGFIGAIVAGAAFSRRTPGLFRRLLDYFAVAAPIGHAIGRLGCFAAGCCSGRPTGLPWGVRFVRPDSLVSAGLLGVPLHPTQLYEALANAVIAVYLGRKLPEIERTDSRRGRLFAAYAALYAAVRFGIEFLRGDDTRGEWIGLSTSQWIALVCLTAAAACGVRWNRKQI